MVDINELMKNNSKTVTFKNGIELTVNCRLSIDEQQAILKETQERELKDSEVAFMVTKSWNLTDWDNPLEFTLENFGKLPLTLAEVRSIIKISKLLEMNIDSKKKDTDEISWDESTPKT